MPTGTRSSISANSVTKPVIATASASMETASFNGIYAARAFDQFRLENQAVSAHRNEQNCRYVADPREGQERPCLKMEIIGQDVVDRGGPHLVQQRPCLNRHHEQKDEGGKNIDDALPLRTGSQPDEIDRNVGAAIGRRATAPKAHPAQKQPTDIISIGPLAAEPIPQQYAT